MTGFYFPVTNGILWYISSMLISGLIVAALYKNNKTKFVNCVAPIIVFISYSLIFYYNGNLDAIGKDASFIVPFGNIRGLAGITIGVLIYTFVEFFNGIEKQKHYKFILSCLEIIAICILIACVVGYGHTKWDFLALIAVPVIIVAAASKCTIWGEFSNKLGNIIAAFMGKQCTLTMYVFSSSVYVIMTKLTNIENLNKYASLGVYLIILIVFSYLVTHLVSFLNNYFIGCIKNGKENVL